MLQTLHRAKRHAPPITWMIPTHVSVSEDPTVCREGRHHGDPFYLPAVLLLLRCSAHQCVQKQQEVLKQTMNRLLNAVEWNHGY